MSQCGPHMWLGVSDQSSGLGERVSIVMPLETLCRLYRELRRQRDILLLPLLVKMKIIVNQRLGSIGLCVAPAPSSQPVEHAGGRLPPDCCMAQDAALGCSSTFRPIVLYHLLASYLLTYLLCSSLNVECELHKERTLFCSLRATPAHQRLPIKSLPESPIINQVPQAWG